MTNIYDTAGERLLQRHLKKEDRLGVAHFKPGQLDARLICEEEVLFVFLSWVDQMGHAVVMPVFQEKDGSWHPMGVYRRAGQETVFPPQQLDESYEIPEKTVRFLNEARETWQPNES